MGWWESLLSRAAAHYDGNEYTPAQAILLGIFGVILFSFFLAKSLGERAIPRYRASDDRIAQFTRPTRYRLNIWVFVVFICMGILLIAYGIFLMFGPSAPKALP